MHYNILLYHVQEHPQLGQLMYGNNIHKTTMMHRSQNKNNYKKGILPLKNPFNFLKN